MQILIPFILLFIFTISGSFGQLKNMSVSAGIVTTNILGDNPASWPVIEQDSTINRGIGGGFSGHQLGFGLKLNFNLDKKEDFVIPVGFDYIYYSALQRIPFATRTTFYLHHTVSVPTATLGLNYYFMKFPIANVRAYGGVEARASFLQQGDYYHKIVWGDFSHVDSVAEKDDVAKSAAFRLGGALKFGLEGEFLSPWFVTFGFSLDAMNLIGRDNSRGELLTLTKSFESSESIVYNLHFIFMITYKFL